MSHYPAPPSYGNYFQPPQQPPAPAHGRPLPPPDASYHGFVPPAYPSMQTGGAFHHNANMSAMGQGSTADHSLWAPFHNAALAPPPFPPPPSIGGPHYFPPPPPSIPNPSFQNTMPTLAMPLLNSQTGQAPQTRQNGGGLHQSQSTAVEREDGELSDMDLSSGPSGSRQNMRNRSPKSPGPSNSASRNAAGSDRSVSQFLHNASVTEPDGSVRLQNSVRAPRREVFRGRTSGENGQHRHPSPKASPKHAKTERGSDSRREEGWKGTRQDQSRTQSSPRSSVTRSNPNQLPARPPAPAHIPPMELTQSNSFLQGNTVPVAPLASGSTSDRAGHPTSESSTREFLAREREKVKPFLLFMHENSYTFSDLLECGLDSTILEGLYRDFGIPINAKSVPSTSPTAPKVNGNSATTDTTPSAHKLSTQLSSTQAKSQELLLSSAKPQAAPVSSQDPPLERKHLIAQALAAKNKKQPTSSVAEAKQSPSASKVVEQKSLPLPKPGLPTRPTTNNNVAVPTPTLSTAQEAEAKRKAQTELARRRIEALESARKAKEIKIPNIPEAQSTPNILRPVNSPSPPHSTSRDSEAQDSGIDNMTDIYDMAPSQSDNAERSELREISRTIPMKSISDDSEQRSEDEATGIPGLFMTTPQRTQILQRNGPVSMHEVISVDRNTGNTESLKSRKRPVASDFDAEPLTYTMKRPFGQDRFDDSSEGMIIEASDDSQDELEDESEEGPMDASSARASTNAANPTALRDHPPLKDNLNKANFTASSNVSNSAPGTPGSYQPANVARDIRRLQKQEEEIVAMKRKIAEAEHKRKTRSLLSGRQTPIISDLMRSIKSQGSVEPGSVEVVDSPLPSESQGQQPTSLSAKASMLCTPSVKGPINYASQENQSQAVHPKQASSLEVTPISADWKSRRRAEIQSGLPAIEASYTNNQTRLDQLRLQMQELENAMRKESESKSKLIKELEGLGIDTEGMEHEELQATKNEVVAQTEAIGAEIATVVAAEAVAATELTQRQDARRISDVSYNSSVSMSTSGNDTDSSHRSLASVPENRNAEEPSDEPAKSPGAGEELASTVELSKSSQIGQQSRNSPTDSHSEVEGDQVSSAAQFSSVEQSPSPSKLVVPVSESEDVDMEDEYGSESGEVASEQAESTSKKSELQSYESDRGATQVLQDEKSPPISIDTEESDISDDYEPPDNPTPVLEDDVMDDEELYEPPEVTQSDVRHEPSPPKATFDVSTTPDIDQEVPPSTTTIDTPIDAIPDKLAKVNRHDEQVGLNGNLPPASTPKVLGSFTPYESPLKLFKAYRNHPEFARTVSGGFRSMSYTHNIDPNLPICEYEVAGGVCNDNTCEDQHFRSMKIPDSQILVQLGTTNPGRTEEEKKRWTDGLRTLLTSLREKHPDDQEPDSIASAITAYRHRFFADSTRVLDL